MKIRVYLQSELTGNEIRIHEEDWEDTIVDTRQELINLIEFQWFENNYACDHNRAIFFGFEDADDDSKFNCVSDIVKVICINEVLPNDSERFILSGDLDEQPFPAKQPTLK